MSSDCEAIEKSGPAAPSQRSRALGALSIWNLYSRVYDLLPRDFRPYQRLLADIVSAVEVNTPKGGRVLDSGCGTGNFSVELGLRGYEVAGIDMSHAMLERARLKKK